MDWNDAFRGSVSHVILSAFEQSRVANLQARPEVFLELQLISTLHRSDPLKPALWRTGFMASHPELLL